MPMPYEAEIRTSSVAPDRAADTRSVVIRHHRTAVAELELETATGGHLLHLALAGCVFNNVLRLAGEQAIKLDRAAVRVGGDFTDAGESTGIQVDIEVAGDAPPETLQALRREAFGESTVVYVLRKATSVELKP